MPGYIIQAQRQSYTQMSLPFPQRQVSMNFLAHLYLSGSDPAVLAGNFMGDFVKGRLEFGYPTKVKDGIILHRKIDSYVQQHELVRGSRQRLSGRYGLYRGVMLDLFYDHFLVVDWARYSDENFNNFLLCTRRSVERFTMWMPTRLVELVPIIFEELIPSYATVAGVGDALRRMGRRIPRDNPLDGSEEELMLHYCALRDDFRQLLPMLETYASYVSTAFESAGMEQD